jgi:hypothetical protein
MTYVVASSAGCPGRFMGTCLPKFFTASSGMVDGIKGVQPSFGSSAHELALLPLLGLAFYTAPFEALAVLWPSTAIGIAIR